MIHRLWSPSLASFKALQFRPGLNILLADKSPAAGDRDTRNSAGKTSIVELVHFLLGADARKGSLFRHEALEEHTFAMELTLQGQVFKVERSGKTQGTVLVSGPQGTVQCSLSKWKKVLGERMFALPSGDDAPRGELSFRNLFGYFARRRGNGGFLEPVRQNEEQRLGAQQMALSWLIGLDWHLPAEFERVRSQETTLRELKKATKTGAVGAVIGTAAELNAKLTIATRDLKNLREQVGRFQVHAEYRDLEKEGAALTKRLNAIANANWADEQLLKELDATIRGEAAPSTERLERLYRDAEVTLPSLVKRRFDEVRAFHESVVRNRRSYLEAEKVEAERRLIMRRQESAELDERRGQVMRILQSTGALDQFTELQSELSRVESRRELLQRQHAAAEQLEGKTVEFELERTHLQVQLKTELAEEQAVVDRAIVAFEETARRLVDVEGSFVIEPTKNGPVFNIHMEGDRSAGIESMKVFCFDMMLMSLCTSRHLGPGFLIHDSHLFDPIDERQVGHALWVGAEHATALNFQYIVMLNSDRLPRSYHEGFDPAAHILPMRLTDAHETGGLFGFRFG